MGLENITLTRFENESTVSVTSFETESSTFYKSIYTTKFLKSLKSNYT